MNTYSDAVRDAGVSPGMNQITTGKLLDRIEMNGTNENGFKGIINTYNVFYASY